MKPGFMGEVGGPRTSIIAGAELAFRLADAYPVRVPAPQELMDRWGMTRSTAYRWVRTMKQARGLLMEGRGDG